MKHLWLIPTMFFLTACRDAKENGEVVLGLEPMPDKLVVLTFDDSVKSHYTVARPVLLKYGFWATFFITEGFTFTTNKKDYMTWGEIAELNRDGFEIGNHTRDHMGVKHENIDRLEEQLAAIDARCLEHGIDAPISFAWPGNGIEVSALEVLKNHGIRWARRGGFPEYPRGGERGFPYEPELDHPLLIPSAAIPRPEYTFEEFVETLKDARDGKVVVLQFHGVPEGEHPWVHVPQETFERFMAYLHEHNFQVISVRGLDRFADWRIEPKDPMAIVAARKAKLGQ